MPRETWGATITPKKNFFFMYIPDGTYPHKIVNQKVSTDSKMSLWYPTSTGTLPTTLPLFLRKLNGNRSDFSLISGFQGCGHENPYRHLTGAKIAATDLLKTLKYPANSFDQVIGSKLAGGSTDGSKIQKYVAGASMISPSGGPTEIRTLGHNIVVLNNKPAFEYTSPAKMFKAIFEGSTPVDPDGNQKYVNTLDLMLADIKSKKQLASAEDKQILERWVTSYEELKGKLATNTPDTDTCSSKPGKPPIGYDSSDKQSLATNYDQMITAFMDINLAAMQCGLRQVGTIMMEAEAALLGFWNNVVKVEDLHAEAGRTLALKDMAVDKHINMAHYGPNGTDMLLYLRLVSINNYFMRKYAYFINGMKTAGIFDDSLAICTYSFRDGNHTGGKHDMPFLCAGKGGGFKVGMHHRVTSAPPEDCGWSEKKTVPMSNLWVSVAKKLYGFNYSNESSTGNLDGLFG
jgi:hypothetical protein